MNREFEEFRGVLGWEDSYQISSLGRVRSIRTGKFRSLSKLPKGYPVTVLSSGGRRRTITVHRLVLEAFVGPCPPGHVCCHKDGDESNNRVENLYWGTPSQNMRDVVRHGNHLNGRKTHCKYGHEFAGENLIVTPLGHRACRKCKNAWARNKSVAQRALREAERV